MAKEDLTLDEAIKVLNDERVKLQSAIRDFIDLLDRLDRLEGRIARLEKTREASVDAHPVS